MSHVLLLNHMLAQKYTKTMIKWFRTTKKKTNKKGIIKKRTFVCSSHQANYLFCFIFDQIELTIKHFFPKSINQSLVNVNILTSHIHIWQ